MGGVGGAGGGGGFGGGVGEGPGEGAGVGLGAGGARGRFRGILNGGSTHGSIPDVGVTPLFTDHSLSQTDHHTDQHLLTWWSARKLTTDTEFSIDHTPTSPYQQL